MHIGQRVMYKGKECKIVAKDDSPPHPAPGLISFKYIVQEIENSTNHYLQDALDLSPIEEANV